MREKCMRVSSVFICALLFLLSGRFPHVHHLPKTDSDANLFPPLPDRLSTLIGIALSGGGSIIKVIVLRHTEDVWPTD